MAAVGTCSGREPAQRFVGCGPLKIEVRLAFRLQRLLQGPLPCFHEPHRPA